MSYVTPPGVDSEVVRTCANIPEDFRKEPLITGEVIKGLKFQITHCMID